MSFLPLCSFYNGRKKWPVVILEREVTDRRHKPQTWPSVLCLQHVSLSLFFFSSYISPVMNPGTLTSHTHTHSRLCIFSRGSSRGHNVIIHSCTHSPQALSCNYSGEESTCLSEMVLLWWAKKIPIPYLLPEPTLMRGFKARRRPRRVERV